MASNKEFSQTESSGVQVIDGDAKSDRRQQRTATPSLMRRLFDRLKSVRSALEDVSIVRTLYWNYRCGLPPFTLIIYPKARVRIASGATIIHRGGRLRLGLRWTKLAAFKPSEFIIASGATLEISGGFEFYTGFSIVVDPGAKLSIEGGKSNTGVRVAVYHNVTLRRDSYLSENVMIRDSDNHSIGGSETFSAPVVIGSNALVGFNSIVLKGVTIGDGCVVAAGSVVTRSTPPKTLVGGVPARVIRENLTWHL